MKWGVFVLPDRNHECTSLAELPPVLLAALLQPTPLPGRSPKLRAGLKALQANWHSIAADADAHVVGPLVYQRLGELGYLDRLPQDVRLAWDADARHARLQHAVQMRGARRISQELTSRSIPHAFVKGLAYRLEYYDPRWTRLGGDIDLIVGRPDIERVRDAMRDIGFLQASCSKDYQNYRPGTLAEITHTESRHYEMAQFVRDFRLHGDSSWVLSEPFVQRVPFAFETLPEGKVLHCCIDIHWCLHFLFQDADPLRSVRWISPSPSEPALPVLSREWSLVYSAFKLYAEAFDRPRFGFSHLADLAAMTSLEIDWSLVSEYVDEYGLDATFFYTMTAVGRLVQREAAPAALMKKWADSGPLPITDASQPALDFGDFMPFVLGRRMSADYFLAEGSKADVRSS